MNIANKQWFCHSYYAYTTILIIITIQLQQFLLTIIINGL